MQTTALKGVADFPLKESSKGVSRPHKVRGLCLLKLRYFRVYGGEGKFQAYPYLGSPGSHNNLHRQADLQAQAFQLKHLSRNKCWRA